MFVDSLFPTAESERGVNITPLSGVSELVRIVRRFFFIREVTDPLDSVKHNPPPPSSPSPPASGTLPQRIYRSGTDL